MVSKKMSNLALALSSYRFHNRLLPQNASVFGGEWNRDIQNNATTWQCMPRTTQKHRSLMVKAIRDPLTVSSRLCADIPFHEAPEASFDDYLEDKQRVFEALFPEKQASERLTEEEWRVHMLPIGFHFLSAYPVIDTRLRCRSNALEEYPPGVPHNTSKALELDIIRWELHGLADVLQPSHFCLGVKGYMYSERHGLGSRLKGQLQITTGFTPPPVLGLVPDHIHREVADSILRRLLETMKQKVFVNLLADYNAFKREKFGVEA